MMMANNHQANFVTRSDWRNTFYTLMIRNLILFCAHFIQNLRSKISLCRQ